MKIGKATARYEEWLSRHLHLLEDDLRLKHEQMRSAPFPFLRATYYRWAQTWTEVCGKEARAAGARSRRPPRRKFRNVARHRGAARLGHQRFR